MRGTKCRFSVRWKTFRNPGPYEIVERARRTRRRPSPTSCVLVGAPNRKTSEVIVRAIKVCELMR